MPSLVTLARLPALLAVLLLSTKAQAETPPAALAGWRVDLELQAGTVLQNDIQRPNNVLGTRFSGNSLAPRNFVGGRAEAAAPLELFRTGDELRLVIAPFGQSGSRRPASPIRYDFATFGTRSAVGLDYRFTTYRLTYDLPIFQDLRQDGWELRVGATLALRDAQIRLSQPGLVRTLSNQGPVPLLYFAAVKDLGAGFCVIGEFDGFPAPGGGGLFDGSVKLAYDLTQNVSVTGGARYVIGGATGSSLFNQLSTVTGVLGVQLRF